MSVAGPSRASVRKDFTDILPQPEETLLLRACLLSGDAARQAWKSWHSGGNNLGESFFRTHPSLTELRPLIAGAVRRSEQKIDKETWTYLRFACLKEEIRSTIVRQICRDILLLLDSERVQTIVLRAMALAETVYDNPVLRHCHDFDLLVWKKDLRRIADLLSSLEFNLIQCGTESEHPRWNLQHRRGFPVELHTCLFHTPCSDDPLNEIRERVQKCSIAGVETNIPGPADQLLDVCSGLFYSTARRSLRWVCDAWLIINRYRDLDWNLLLDCAHRARLALPLSIMLRYLTVQLGAAIPPTFVERLSAATEGGRAELNSQSDCTENLWRF